MEADAGVGGVDGVTMLDPAGRVQIDLDIARDGCVRVELEQCPAEVGTGFAIPETGMEDGEGLAVDGVELVAVEALMTPDLLEGGLRGTGVGGGLAEGGSTGPGFTPAGIEIGGQRMHD